MSKIGLFPEFCLIPPSIFFFFDSQLNEGKEVMQMSYLVNPRYCALWKKHNMNHEHHAKELIHPPPL